MINYMNPIFLLKWGLFGFRKSKDNERKIITGVLQKDTFLYQTQRKEILRLHNPNTSQKTYFQIRRLCSLILTFQSPPNVCSPP